MAVCRTDTPTYLHQVPEPDNTVLAAAHDKRIRVSERATQRIRSIWVATVAAHALRTQARMPAHSVSRARTNSAALLLPPLEGANCPHLRCYLRASTAGHSTGRCGSAELRPHPSACTQLDSRLANTVNHTSYAVAHRGQRPCIACQPGRRMFARTHQRMQLLSSPRCTQQRSRCPSRRS